MRNRSFQSAVHRASRAGVGLLALLVAASGPASSRAAATITAGDLGTLSTPSTAPNAAAGAAGDVPAFAGRVDPDTYRVGPGDEFAFRSSDLLDPKIIRVGPTGEILLPDAGSIAVAGLTLREMDAKARDVLRPYIRGKGFTLTLFRPRRFRAVVVGDVARPGAVLVQAPVRASDAIEAAGGVAPGGARRGIVVRRGADSLWVDLVRFERSGDLDANPLVFETDVIVVPSANRRVDVMGAVPHPGWYDLAPGDRASTLLDAAGGLLARAAGDRITVSRESAPGHRADLPVATLGASDAGAAGASVAAPGDPVLEPGDRILVPERAHWREGSRVDIRGEVALPGPYAIEDGVDRLGALFERAGGFTEWADSNAIRIERDTDAAMRDTAFVRLAREQAGLVPDGERDYLVALSRANDALSVSAAGWAKSGRSAASWKEIALLDGDRVIVPRRTLTVVVEGEVRTPGHVAFEAGRRVGDYVDAAGGYTGRANRGDVRVTLAATGRAVSAGDVGALHAGDTIWVPAREVRSAWSVAREILTTAAQVATIYLVIQQATK